MDNPFDFLFSEPHKTLKSLYKALDSNISSLEKLLRALRQYRERISEQKYETVFLKDRLKFQLTDPNTAPLDLQLTEIAFREALEELKEMQETFEKNKRMVCPRVIMFLCNVVTNRLEFTSKPKDSLELEEDPFACYGIDMHEGFINLINEYHHDILAWGNLFDRLHLRIMAGNCLYKKPYHDLILFNAIKLFNWTLEGQYDQKKRIELGYEIVID